MESDGGIDQRADKLLELLDIERDAEIEEFDKLFQTLSKKVTIFVHFRILNTVGYALRILPFLKSPVGCMEKCSLLLNIQM
jgi:hypothetical protein